MKQPRDMCEPVKLWDKVGIEFSQMGKVTIREPIEDINTAQTARKSVMVAYYASFFPL